MAPRLAVLTGLVLLVLALPAGNDSLAYNATQAVVFAIVGLSMNLLVGYTGQLSLGQQGFFGLGAMVAANVTRSGTNPADPLSFGFGLVVPVVVGAAAAVVLGLVALRVTGLYLALLTLVFGAAMTTSVLGIPALNGNDAGVKAVRPDLLASNLRYYLFCLAVLGLVLYVDRQLLATKAGRAMLATKDNELAAAAFGINVVSTKLLAFALSGALAGLAGALIVFLPQTFSQKNYVGPVGFNLALTFVVVAVVGGLGSRLGVVVASAFFGLLDYLLSGAFSLAGASSFYIDHKNYLPGLIGALLLLDTVVRRPGGLGELLAPLVHWLGGRPAAQRPASHVEVTADARA